ncbi:Protein glutamine dumper 3 [Apostasia shenzhenica]|uniref:Protein glutamine dumper 3 n=1 Tax=Apostasia shenzhenica TaxID=1088818 RepID=A0A2I0APW0_9ASPA|nr:Protein glutamine dumper 3 [Apostasia shenzhenica]
MRASAADSLIAGASAGAPSPEARSSAGHHSAWHSPVPYVFSGFAAMLGLITFALLILACSYWRLSSLLETAGGDGEDAGKAGDDRSKVRPPAHEETIVVIMAGDKKPTFLAAPISSRVCSFGERNDSPNGSCTAAGTPVTVCWGLTEIVTVASRTVPTVRDPDWDCR